MHFISPYTVRCYDPASKAPKLEDRYSALGKVGQFDAYFVLKDFIQPLIGSYKIVAGRKQIFRFHDVVFDDASRQFYGWFQAGSYGLKSDIVNIKTGNVDYYKVQENAEMINHYVHFFLPKDFNEGVAILHGYKNIGIKTLLHSLVAAQFKKVTGRVLQMHPLAYEKAMVEWQDAQAKEIRLVKYKGMAHLEDQIAALGNQEQELVIRATRKKSLGRLQDYFKAGSEQLAAVEVLTPLCSEVKTVVEMGGRRRTFRVGANPRNHVCEVELDEAEVPVIAGNPEPISMLKWCRKLLQDFVDSVYPKLGVKV